MTEPFEPTPPTPETGGVPPMDAPDKDAKLWATLAHLGGFFLCLGFLPSLIIWLVKKDDSPFVADQAKEALNFQIWVFIAGLVAWIIAMATCVGSILNFVIFIADVVLMIMAAIDANKGNLYRYPIPYPRLVK